MVWQRQLHVYDCPETPFESRAPTIAEARTLELCDKCLLQPKRLVSASMQI